MYIQRIKIFNKHDDDIQLLKNQLMLQSTVSVWSAHNLKRFEKYQDAIHR